MAALGLLAACNNRDKQEDIPPTVSPNAKYEALLFTDAAMQDAAGIVLPENLAIEVALDRLGFSSGVIDGKATRFDELALRGFQEANGLPPTGRLDPPTEAVLSRSPARTLRTVRIPQGFAAGPFVPDLPSEAGQQAQYEHLSYRDMREALAERFHTTPELLAAINPPGTMLGAGAAIRVPNIPDVEIAALDDEDARGWNRTLVTLGVSPDQPSAERVVVDKSDGALRAYGADGALLAQFPATMGSEHDPLPIGEWRIVGVGKNPDFHYNPELFWDVSDAEPSQMLRPGPNSPVGVVWIDLSKEHYGIHGTPEPASIGHSESHGCVRLTNWDAARLAQMVGPETPAIFQE